jgi:hypothetical protein
MALILDWLEGRLSPERARAVEVGIANGGPETALLVSWVREFMRDAALLPLATPPPLVSQRLRRLLTSKHQGRRHRREFTAVPILDTRRTEQLVGVRAPAQAGSRFQLTFGADPAVIVLDVQPASDGTATIRGQVIPDDASLPVFHATAIGPSGRATTILGDDLGGFTLRGVPLDVDFVVVTNDDVDIVVPVHLGESESPRDEP